MKIGKLLYRFQPLLTLCFFIGLLALMLDAAIAQEKKVKTHEGASTVNISKLQSARIQALQAHRKLDAAIRPPRMLRGDEKIVGGVNARPGRWPFAAAIVYASNNSQHKDCLLPNGENCFQFCGGTLIGPQWVITAAHCQVWAARDDYAGDMVIVNRNTLTTSGGEIARVVEVVNHPNYDDSTNDNDIALLRLDQALTMLPAVLIGAEGKFAEAGNLATVVGWGRLEEGGASSEILQQVNISILSDSACSDLYQVGGANITSNMFCAGLKGKDSCQGDSGGGLFVDDKIRGGDRIAGIVSWGIGCAQEQFPGVYTRVANYTDWITQVSGIKPPPETDGCPECRDEREVIREFLQKILGEI